MGLTLHHLHAVERCDLEGVLKGADGKPIASANVWVYTADVKKGTNPLCPSCYTDCSKKAVTDQEGRFTLSSLDSELKFTILVQGDGYKPMLVSEVDPVKGTMEAKLEIHDWKELDPKRVLRGRVVDSAGAPVVGAELTPLYFDTTSVSRSAEGVFEPVAVSDSKGQFVIAAKDPILFVVLNVKARGLAPVCTEMLRQDRAEHEIRLGPGVVVMDDGEPVKNASMGLVSTNRSAGNYFTNLEITANENGEFRFDNVPPNTDYTVYTLMDKAQEKGAAALIQVRTGADDGILDAGSMEMVPSHRISGRVVLEDGSPTPAGVRVLISRSEAWDHQYAKVDKDGTFSFKGLPSEEYNLSVSVPGYRLSPKNGSFWLSSDSLYGRVDRSVEGLVVLLEKGKRNERSSETIQAEKGRKRNLRRTELKGVPPTKAAP